jgi:uncharacterized protein YciI
MNSTDKKHFLIKLIPPRSTFPQDITENEQKIMTEHGAYWTDLMNRGMIIVFGPVFDPKGAWGLGIAEVESEDQIRGLIADDPSVKCGLNTFEIYPIHATFRK